MFCSHSDQNISLIFFVVVVVVVVVSFSAFFSAQRFVPQTNSPIKKIKESPKS